jgi:cell wall-associated NlpC family hydrolase
MTIREKIVAEAETWLGTPFHHAARVKGAGVDCINLLAAVYSSVGLIEPVELDYYPIDWHMHRDEPRFLAGLADYCGPLPAGETPKPGDIAMFQYGRHAAHGAIVINWPLVVHAWSDVGRVTMTEADRGPLGKRLAGIYRVRGIE